MSRIAEYAQKEQLMKQLQEELLKLEQNDDLKKEIEFKDQLEMLMKEYEKTAKEVIQIIAPERFYSENEQKKTTTRKPRKLKVYKNPHTGEVVETRGGNQKQIKQWKEEHGDETVESWLVTDDGDNVDVNKAVEEAPTPSADTEQEEAQQEEQKEPTKDEKASESSNKGKKEKEEEAKQ